MIEALARVSPWMQVGTLLWVTGLACRPSSSEQAGDDSTTTTTTSSESSEGEDPPEIPMGCGNGIVEPGEDCDLGFANAVDGACTPSCTEPRCGDGFVADGEACDEGPDNGSATCSVTCEVPTRLVWSETVSGSDHRRDTGHHLAPMPDGGVIMLSERRNDRIDMVVERYGPDGPARWSLTLPGNFRYNVAGVSLLTTADGRIFIGHGMRDYDTEETHSLGIRLVELDGEGRVSWTHEMLSTPDEEVVRAQMLVMDSRILLAATVVTDDFYSSGRVVRFDAQRMVQSETTDEEGFRHVAPGLDGGFYALGINELRAYDADDQLRWTQPVAQTLPPRLAADSTGRVAVTYWEYLSDSRELWLFDPEGTKVQTIALEHQPSAVSVGPDDMFVVAGRASAEPGELPNNTRLGIEVFDSDGRRRWSEAINGPAHGDDQAHGATATANGSVWLCGNVLVPYEEHDAWIGLFDGSAP